MSGRKGGNSPAPDERRRRRYRRDPADYPSAERVSPAYWARAGGFNTAAAAHYLNDGLFTAENTGIEIRFDSSGKLQVNTDADTDSEMEIDLSGVASHTQLSDANFSIVHDTLAP